MELKKSNDLEIFAFTRTSFGGMDLKNMNLNIGLSFLYGLLIMILTVHYQNTGYTMHTTTKEF